MNPYIGKQEGLSDFIKKNAFKSDNNKLFMNPIVDETVEHLLRRIYHYYECWFLTKGTIPKYIVLANKDYQNLLNRTNKIENNKVFGMEINFFHKKDKSKERNEKKYEIKNQSNKGCSS